MRLKTYVKLAALAAPVLLSAAAFGQQLSMSPNDVNFKLSLGGGDFSKAVNVFLLMTALSLAPSFVILMTSFLRISIVLNILKKALGTQDVPSARVMASISLFLTIFVMRPVWTDVYNNAIKPYSEQKITQTVALEKAVEPVKGFMLRQTRESCLLLFMDLSQMEAVDSPSDLPMTVVVPSFVLSELKTSFQMGFLIYLPFLLIDVVTATILMSMGMMMLPPMMISMPFKLLLFIVIDGWEIMMKTLVNSFQ